MGALTLPYQEIRFLLYFKFIYRTYTHITYITSFILQMYLRRTLKLTLLILTLLTITITMFTLHLLALPTVHITLGNICQCAYGS